MGEGAGDSLLHALAGASQQNVTAAAQARSFAGALAHHHSRAPRPGVLLDRDGTIIIDYGYVGSVGQVEFIDGAADAIARLNQAGVPVALVTNQSGVARGFYGIDDVTLVHQHIAEYLHKRGPALTSICTAHSILTGPSTPSLARVMIASPGPAWLRQRRTR